MATDEYKLVFFERLGDCVSSDFAMHIFSTRDSSWKIIRAPHLSFFQYESKALIFTNGACHWFCNGVAKRALYAFDLTEEVVRELPLPPALMPNRNSNDMYAADASVMKKYDVLESWVKMFQCSELDLPDLFASRHLRWMPVYVTEGGTVVISFSDKELVRIECHREEKPCRAKGYANHQCMRIPAIRNYEPEMKKGCTLHTHAG
ncbi:uncharacterized protein LOC126795859 [Argentina anserina]|uniref:uncharacterized protein LOC126795859 n=1 Tax=Argentina anserina TaxID=57926 RepID=UPI0021764975|nr:uncharacterized protein LOC126795859 [Potentilla anserina]